MDNLLAQASAEGGYQDIEVDGTKLFTGWRQCDQRWEIIKPHIAPRGSIIDIGSHYGYFSIKAAKAYPEAFIWSLEGDLKRAHIQRQVLEANRLKNIVLSQHHFGPQDVLSLYDSCNSFNTILLLSVAHYFKPTELSTIIKGLANLAPNLIIEFPSKDEKDVAERDMIRKTDILAVLSDHYDRVELIGEAPSPKHPKIMRPIYKATIDYIDRMNCPSYINGSGNHHLKCQFGKWTIDGKLRRFNGMTLEDLRHFGMLYPISDTMLMGAADLYDTLIKQRKGQVTDINIRNVLITNDGLRAFDYEEGIGKPIYDMPWADYVKRTLSRDIKFHTAEFTQMWNGTWQP